MVRDIDMLEISDGKRYTHNDMVKVVCDDCKDCHACCKNMEAIILDPLDIYNITKGTGYGFEDLLRDYIEIKVVDGVFLPSMKMNSDTNACNFLNAEGRCKIHPYRPGICRLFPLGRIYEENGFKYFLQNNECSKANLSKIKIKKWLGILDINKYESFVLEWHNFIKIVGEDIRKEESSEKARQIGMMLLQLFYVMPYDTNVDFYSQFEERMNRVRGK